MNLTDKKLGLFDLLSIGVGSVIGAGIFSMLCTGISMTGRSIAPALILAMALTIVQQVRNIFMSSMFAMSGGMYSQQALVLPPIFTGITVIAFIFSSFSFTVFGVSMAAYLAQLFPVLAPYQKLLAVLLLSAFFLAAVFGVNSLAKIQNVMAVCMYLALGMFIVFGLFHGGSAEAVAAPYFASGGTGFMIAVAIMSYTCSGATNIINLTGNAKNPKRNIPLGVLLSAGICSLIYFLLGFVASKNITVADASSATLGTVAQQILPSGLYICFVIGGAILALATSLVGGISARTTPIVVGAEDGWLPLFLAKRNKYGTPWVVIFLMYLFAVVPAIFEFSLDTVVSFILVPGMIVNVVCGILTYNLPKRFEKEWESCGLHCPYWLYCVLLTISILASIITALFSMISLDLVGIVGNIALTVFMFVFSAWRLKSGKVNLDSIKGI